MQAAGIRYVLKLIHLFVIRLPVVALAFRYQHGAYKRDSCTYDRHGTFFHSHSDI